MKLMEYIKILEKPAPVVEGIYFSHKTGKIFEAKKFGNKIRTKYTCGGFGPTVTPYIFRIQFEVMELYELLIPYKDD